MLRLALSAAKSYNYKYKLFQDRRPFTSDLTQSMILTINVRLPFTSVPQTSALYRQKSEKWKAAAVWRSKNRQWTSWLKSTENRGLRISYAEVCTWIRAVSRSDMEIINSKTLNSRNLNSSVSPLRAGFCICLAEKYQVLTTLLFC